VYLKVHGSFSRRFTRVTCIFFQAFYLHSSFFGQTNTVCGSVFGVRPKRQWPRDNMADEEPALKPESTMATRLHQDKTFQERRRNKNLKYFKQPGRTGKYDM